MFIYFHSFFSNGRCLFELDDEKRGSCNCKRWEANAKHQQCSIKWPVKECIMNTYSWYTDASLVEFLLAFFFCHHSTKHFGKSNKHSKENSCLMLYAFFHSTVLAFQLRLQKVGFFFFLCDAQSYILWMLLENDGQVIVSFTLLEWPYSFLVVKSVNRTSCSFFI